MVNLDKVHESCEKLERHLTKLGQPLTSMLCAVGYLQLSAEIQWEGFRKECEERTKRMGKLSWTETEKTSVV